MPELYSSTNSQPEKKTLISKKILKNVIKDLRPLKTNGFQPFPKHVKFETQEHKEQIILLTRQHFATNIKSMLITVLLFLAPFIFSKMLPTDFISGKYLFFIGFIWFLIVFAFILETVLSWYFNVYIITDERIIDIDSYSLIYKRVSEAKIDKIEDVTHGQGGLFQSIFNYGTIYIQTAGEKTEFEFENVPFPAKITSVLNQLILHEEQEKYEGRIS